MTGRHVLAAAIAAVIALPAAAQERYRIGLSGALTGPFAGSYAPAVEGLQLYIERLNANGGIDGREVELIVLDDSGEASRGAANVRRLLNQERVSLLINASLSATYAPMMADTQRARVPLLFASSACPPEVSPPANPLMFCTTAFASGVDSRATLGFIEETSGTDIDIGMVSMGIPLSRSEVDNAAILAESMGMRVLENVVVPPVTPDFTPYATRVQQRNVDWVYSWAPWVTQVRTFEAMRRLGWQGNFAGWAHLEAEGEMARMRDPGFFAIGAHALFAEDLPVHQDVRAAAQASGASYPYSQMTEGWVAGMVIEAALRQAGWPAGPAEIAASMQNLTVDTQGLRGGPIVWRDGNHFRTTQYYRVYRWDDDSNAIVVVRDWFSFDIE